ncbi:hypothetical protein THAOC_35889 [Thalassiosira oceanica]|uniref:Uncharacterized protein n=1 Tax=Thalassiosira oceanica TaxID=159749 RepID=K0R9A2_THAOC|nr:hypothetical protein THAOC_35889 [Thalassiosira oceanica]|eukprot:EJK45496.1 hypothetical protein THAOC_35889 [Thalassiosira oceanica]
MPARELDRIGPLAQADAAFIHAYINSDRRHRDKIRQAPTIMVMARRLRDTALEERTQRAPTMARLLHGFGRDGQRRIPDAKSVQITRPPGLSLCFRNVSSERKSQKSLRRTRGNSGFLLEQAPRLKAAAFFHSGPSLSAEFKPLPRSGRELGEERGPPGQGADGKIYAV